MRKWLRSGLAAGPIALAALAASAALSSGDRNFVQTATSSGLAEVATAQLAQQRFRLGSGEEIRRSHDRRSHTGQQRTPANCRAGGYHTAHAARWQGCRGGGKAT